MTALTRGALLALFVLFVSAVGTIGGGEMMSRWQRNAFAADALPRVQHEQVCDESSAAGTELHHAAVVIVFPDGTDTYCVAFDEDELSGVELLERTGLPLVLSGFGGLGDGVCRIDGIGCSDPGDCFCQCRGADCHYWTYFELDDAEWDFLPVGASQRRVHDGDIDGWVWGNGRTPPGESATGAICSAALPTPVPIATPTPPGNEVRPTATRSLPSAGITPGTGVGNAGRQQPIATQRVVATQVRPTAQTAVTGTSEPRVVRQSSRPTSESTAGRTEEADQDGGLPVGLIAFAAVATGLVAVGGGVIAKRRLDG